MRKVNQNGDVGKPYKVKDLAWFYAGRGHFHFFIERDLTKAQAAKGHPANVKISTRTLRAALALVDSVKKRSNP